MMTTHHPQFPSLLASVAACATATMPQATARIEHAAVIVLAGGVEPSTHGYTVQSQSRDTWYDVVDNVCTCVDYERHATHTNGYACKHVIATWLYRRVEQRLVTLDAEYTPLSPDNGCLLAVD